MATKTKKLTFKSISSNETIFEYKGKKFLLLERSRGVLSLGRAVQLYLLEDFDRKHLKEMGWTRTDNHSGPGGADPYIPGITTLEEIKSKVTDYIDEFI